MKSTAAASLALALLSGALYCRLGAGFWLSLAITGGTTFYHLAVRLLAGALLGRKARRPNPDSPWYRQRRWEARLYEILRVKDWKGKLPTYSPESFSPALHSWEEIAQSMCRSELVHEANILLSFPPVLAAVWFGDLPVFLATSLLAAIFDLLFVMIQRYNRPRVARLAARQKRNQKGKSI